MFFVTGLSCFRLRILHAQVVQGQLIRDKNVIDLISDLNHLYAFVDGSQTLRHRVQHFETVIIDALRATENCAKFVKEYVEPSFKGTG